MKIKIQNLIIALALLAGVHQAFAQGTTAFTYQGQLHDGGTNANGTYTMIFKLYDAVTSGNSLGTNTSSPTLVNGLFSVNLDFGNAFNGAARWLDITVTNGGVTQTLSPRVQVLPTPYAQFAAVAAVAATAPNGVSLGGTNFVPNIQLFNSGSSGTFVVPTNVTRIMVEMWGAGGGGGTANGSFFGGGGGGSSYSLGVFTVTAGSSYSYSVPGSATGGQNGGAATFSGPGISMSAGGGFAGANATSSSNGAGGNAGTASGGNVVNASGVGGDNHGDGGGVFRGGQTQLSGVQTGSGGGTGPGSGGIGGNNPSNNEGNSGAIFVTY
jgi:hypothetical protein